MATIAKNQREIELYTNGNGLIADHRKKVSLLDYATPLVEKSKRSNGKAFLGYLQQHFGGLQLGGVDEKAPGEFQEYLGAQANGGKGLKASTIETYFNLLSSMLNKAVREKYLRDNPMKYLKRTRAEEPMLE